MTSPASGAGSAVDLPDYAPIPRSALGPALNDQGYYVGRVERNLYWVTDGVYQAAFLTTADGVVVFDAPPSIGHNLRRAVDEIAAANGVSNTVTHLVYSHHHHDHAGASSIFGDVVRVGHEETKRLLTRDNDPGRPVPDVTFADRYTLEVGGERAELAWHGPNHSPDNIFIHFDASPIGQNARSTPATYSGAFDRIRRMFAESGYARRRRWKPGHFSFNTREGQCPTCRGLGHIDLDVQYLPDITVSCPTCAGARLNEATLAVQVDGLTIADVLGLSVNEALERFAARGPVAAALRPVSEVGLGYLKLGEPTPSLSGGESQRLRIASRLRSSQRGTLYVFDEPSTGLHPLDVATLAGVFDRLLDAGATIIVIDHDLDLLAAADHLIDMGPGGGPDGGRILAAGTPQDVGHAPGSATGPWLAEHLGLPTDARVIAL